MGRFILGWLILYVAVQMIVLAMGAETIMDTWTLGTLSRHIAAMLCITGFLTWILWRLFRKTTKRVHLENSEL